MEQTSVELQEAKQQMKTVVFQLDIYQQFFKAFEIITEESSFDPGKHTNTI
jgi:hypothetical protein